MNLIYNEKNIVIAAFDSNIESSSFSVDSFKKMFPSKSTLSYCCLNVSSILSPIGSKIEIKCGVPYKLTKNEEVLFELSPEELEKIIKENEKEAKKSQIFKFPCTASKYSISSFIDRVLRFPQTYRSIAEELKNGSYFDHKIIKVGWWGCFTDAGGYANMNREITRRLHNFYIIPYIKIYNTINQVEAQTLDILSMYSDLSPKKGEHPYVYAYTPMSHGYHSGKKIFFTMMETASLHPVFLNHCNKYSDEVWVPSQSNKEIFSSCGVKKPIKVVTLGIDEILYLNANIEKKKFCSFTGLFGKNPQDGINNFKFLTVIQWNFRKGFDALIASFVNAFDSSDDVCLVITTQYAAEIVRNDLKHFLPRTTNLPQVLLYNQVIPTIEMPMFYKNFDCYVHFSRGEGFSLTQIEAAACGLPVISCFHSGMTEYLTDENSYKIECNEIEHCHSRLASLCYFYQGQSLWKLGKKQIEQGCDHMRYVQKNYERALKKAQVFLRDVENKYTWDKTAERVADLLKI